MLEKIVELLVAALLGGMVTMAIGYLLLGGKVKELGAKLGSLDKNFGACRTEHEQCAEGVKAEIEMDIKDTEGSLDHKITDLADVVSDLTRTTGILSADVHSHLQVSQQLDTTTNERFSRIEKQLGRIESKLDQLKGWRVVEN